MKLSVAMAVYNGEAYLQKQLDSILNQLGKEDEVVISLDPSQDESEHILQQTAQEDPRIVIVPGPGKGVSANFENALSHTSGDLIFLADQDDVWTSDKVCVVRSLFESDQSLLLLMHDAVMTDKNLSQTAPSFFEFRGCREGIIKNIWKNSFIGCCMVFRSELKPYILPFPKGIPMHDQWIGLAASSLGKVMFLKQTLLCYRRHGSNVSQTTHAGTAQMLLWRIGMIWAYLTRKRGKLL